MATADGWPRSCATMSEAASDDARMSGQHRLLALSIVLIWASNFVALRWGLDRMSPLALCFWRFLLSFFPACLFVRIPTVNWKLAVGFGVLTGLGQFGALAAAIQGHISAGLASALVQVQAVINVALAGLILHERVTRAQIAGCLLSFVGLGIFMVRPDANATALGVILVVIAAVSWAVCNVLVKAGGYRGDLLQFLVWTSPIAMISLGVLEYSIDGPQQMMIPLIRPTPGLWAIIAWQAFANTLYGYAVWNFLIRRYSLGRIGPLTLLVPIVAMALTALLLGERVTALQLLAALTILSGVAVPALAPLIWKSKAIRFPAANPNGQ